MLTSRVCQRIKRFLFEEPIAAVPLVLEKEKKNVFSYKKSLVYFGLLSDSNMKTYDIV